MTTLKNKTLTVPSLDAINYTKSQSVRHEALAQL